LATGGRGERGFVIASLCLLLADTQVHARRLSNRIEGSSELKLRINIDAPNSHICAARFQHQRMKLMRNVSRITRVSFFVLFVFSSDPVQLLGQTCMRQKLPLMILIWGSYEHHE
jgi:hypothetical protein